VKAGDLLIGMDGEFGCYEWQGEPALLNQRVCRLQGFSGELIPRFLFYGKRSEAPLDRAPLPDQDILHLRRSITAPERCT